MTCASHRNLRAWAGLIIAPESKLASEINPVRASHCMVMVTCGPFAALDRAQPGVQIPAEGFDQPVGPPVRRGPWVLHRVTRLVPGSVRVGVRTTRRWPS